MNNNQKYLNIINFLLTLISFSNISWGSPKKHIKLMPTSLNWFSRSCNDCNKNLNLMKPQRSVPILFLFLLLI